VFERRGKEKVREQHKRVSCGGGFSRSRILSLTQRRVKREENDHAATIVVNHSEARRLGIVPRGERNKELGE